MLIAWFITFGGVAFSLAFLGYGAITAPLLEKREKAWGVENGLAGRQRRFIRRHRESVVKIGLICFVLAVPLTIIILVSEQGGS